MTTPAQGSETPPVAVSVHRSGSSAEFFNAAERGVLLIRRCSRCQHARAARRAVCRRCGASEFEWVEAAGSGVLRSWAANATRDPAGQSVPFGLVELAEGPWVESLLIDVEAADLHEGAPFTVAFVRGPEGDTFPAFRPAQAS